MTPTSASQPANDPEPSGIEISTLDGTLTSSSRPQSLSDKPKMNFTLETAKALAENAAERERAEEALHQAQEELEERVLQRTAQLEAVNRSLQVEIEERNRTEEALRDSEFRFRSITESANQAIITSDMAGNICSWNRGAEIMFGYRENEVLGKPLTVLMPERYRAAHWEGLERLRQTGRPRILGRTIELQGLKKDGAEFAAELSLALWHAGQDTFYTGIVADISLRKRAEDSLRELSGRLLQLQDEERRRLARELHDSTAQTLSALSLNLALLSQGVDFASQPRMARAVAESVDLADRASRELRTFSYLLHPPLLDEAGLAEALRWYVEGFTQRTKIEVDLTISPADLGRLSTDVEMTLFRLVQESLTNVFRHSGSKTAVVTLAIASGEIVLEVSDQGTGFPAGVAEPGGEAGAALGVGVRGMRERVRQLGGSMELESTPLGARVKVALPFRGSAGIAAEPSTNRALPAESKASKKDVWDKRDHAGYRQ